MTTVVLTGAGSIHYDIAVDGVICGHLLFDEVRDRWLAVSHEAPEYYLDVSEYIRDPFSLHPILASFLGDENDEIADAIRRTQRELRRIPDDD